MRIRFTDRSRRPKTLAAFGRFPFGHATPCFGYSAKKTCEWLVVNRVLKNTLERGMEAAPENKGTKGHGQFVPG